MPLGPDQSRDRSSQPEVAFAQHLANLQSRIANLESRRTQIPCLDADPPIDLGINMWFFPDGRLRMYRPTTSTNPVTYVITEFAAVAVPGPPANSITAVAPNATAPLTQMGTYAATWSQAYGATGAPRGDLNTKISFGYDASTGVNRSLIGFDWVTIAADLTGSTVLGVSFQLQMLDTSQGASSTIFFGVHNFTAAPGTWLGDGLPVSKAISGTFARNTLQEIDLTLDFGTLVRDGLGKGVAVEAPNDSLLYSGTAAGFGGAYPAPVLLVEYVK